MQFEDRAVQALAALMDSTALTDALREVETASGLPAGDIPNPARVVQTFLPFNHESPLVQVFDESWVTPGDGRRGQQEGIRVVKCGVVVSYTANRDLERADTLLRRYSVAIQRAIQANPRLRDPRPGVPVQPDPQVTAGLIKAGDRITVGDDATTRHHRGVTVEVRVATP